jgi:hypothetical protein
VPVSKEDKEIKITDKRMFTADGELREEYRFLEEKSNAAEPQAAAPGAPAASSADAAAAGPAPSPAASRSGAAASPAPPPPPSPQAGAPSRPASPREGPPPDFDDSPSARLELPGSPPGLGPTFYDLAGILAEPIPVYLGDIDLPDGQSAENIEMARLYIDLLDVLRQKTVGNLTAQESAFLEDLLYRSRVRYVQKRG